MSTESVVRLCAPTLAGMKVASLFTTSFTSMEELLAQIVYYNNLLRSKGLYFEILRIRESTALILVYRKNKIKAILHRADVQQFLQAYGYVQFDLAACLAVLKAHLQREDFPHEIGVFLGYPLADIKAFIQHKGQKHKFVGYWKVYTNEEEAKQTFRKFDKCTRVYREKFNQGTEITRLAIVV